ncbi:hypothetical protein HYPSUDRAFT_484250 [Hypholoma sublateritium FD-334 SS-4]|uniref:Heterokaryon incompatibility domain-containing protein n=1 Tax=Hypholoma sublateritium (strain FD-334 SS-4) TaxID=945553 RepID=A0A0D2NZK7_HYPSF|nr:hypothetical protein HYPSUDRAFT_484250 [Hypholoma sublateritium FD-334 SS-4]
MYPLHGISSQCGPPAPTDSDGSDVKESYRSANVQPAEGWDAHVWESSGFHLIIADLDTRRQQLIEEIMAKSRDTVFNNMPIRLLMFDQDGKGIKLVERSELMECISSAVNSVTNLEDPYEHPFANYAILSHTWLPSGEVTYSEWKTHTALLDTQSPGYNKLAKFCEEAARRGLRLGWMDTVCINKESSSELDESIRSMFKWYRGAEVCIAFLAETTSRDDMENDKWFTRGWTLQELIAPRYIKFFSKNWEALSDSPTYISRLSDKLKNSPLMSQICNATGLVKEEVFDSTFFINVPIWRKMQWAANRKVTREEDTAYSLMGLFDVSMPTGYGEGADYAFYRLIREILSSKITFGSTSKLEIANWSFGHANRDSYDFYSGVSSSALIPSSPRAYTHSNRNVAFYSPSPLSLPITLSHMGLCVPVLLMPFSIVEKSTDNTPLPKGNYSATFGIGDDTYRVLDGALFSSEESCNNVSAFAVLNIVEKPTEVLLPENGLCFAIKLQPQTKLEGWEIPEDLVLKAGQFDGHRFTFDIVCHNNSSLRIPKDELNHHGMTFRTMYL